MQLDGTFDRQLAQITKCDVSIPDAQASNNTPGIELTVGAFALLVVAALVRKIR